MWKKCSNFKIRLIFGRKVFFLICNEITKKTIKKKIWSKKKEYIKMKNLYYFVTVMCVRDVRMNLSGNYIWQKTNKKKL